MANIIRMRMWESICNDARISIQKSLFGLRTTAIYTPTNSVIDANTFEYSQKDGAHIRQILDTPREKLSETIGDFHPTTCDYGNYMAEVGISRDRTFLAVQLFQYQTLNYEAVSKVMVFEGRDAVTVSSLFA